MVAVAQEANPLVTAPVNPAPNGPTPTPNQMPGATAPAAPAAPAAVEPPAGVPPAPAVTTPAAPPAAQPPAAVPPWEASGEAFDPERAWNLIQNLRGENTGLKGQLTPLQDAADASRRAEQGVLATAQEDLGKANTRGDTWRDTAVRFKAQVLAAGARFRDPSDAITMLGDLSGFVNGDTIDEAGLAVRINTLAAEKSYLLSDGTPPPPPPAGGLEPNRAQGQSGTGADATLDAQIAAAQARGDFTAAIALKQQKHLK